VEQDLALKVMESGENVFLTGSAGTGKTYVLGAFIRAARAAGRHVAVTASTGLAATHLDGNTVHAWSGIGIHDELGPTFLSRLPRQRREAIRAADVRVSDEISMLHDYRLDMVDEVCRSVRSANRPFGGLQVVVSGDFFQLPPVNSREGRQGGFAVASQAWRGADFQVAYLTEQHRQDDPEFLAVLEALRAGEVEPIHVERLRSRIGAPLEGEATELHTVNRDVERLNLARLEHLPGPERTFDMTGAGDDRSIATLKRSCLAQPQLRLRPDCLVMAIRNAADQRYVNGSLGIVTGFDEASGWPVVELADGQLTTMRPATWELRDGESVRASVAQVPLRLAWAVTVHKSQGMTLDAARIDLRRAFEPGMGYVALSRVRALDRLSLAGLNRMALTVARQALRMDHAFRQASAAAAARFAGLT
jgi:ATP-dependent exoDNAse (exonuclease V) alpha subunit